MAYDLYPLDIFEYIEEIIPKKIRKKTTFNQQMLLSSAIASTVIPDFFRNLLFNISYLDKTWVEKGKKIIFLDQAMANELIFSKALVSKTEEEDFVLTLPFRDFMVSLPHHLTMPDGTVIPPFMVSLNTQRTSVAELVSFGEEIIAAHPEYTKNQFVYGASLENDTCDHPRVSYRFKVDGVDNPLGQTVTQTLLCSEIGKLISMTTPEEFVESRRGTKIKGTDALELEDSESRINYYILKLIVSMSMYHSATEGKYLRHGLPSAATVKGFTKNIRTGAQYLLTEPVNEKDYKQRKDHVRGWHYRNLRADCYYQNEHKDKPRGSRWVLVASSFVSGRVKPDTYTQE